MSTPEYFTASGRATTADDPERLLFDSAHCTFWTDDWSKVKTHGTGIPGCPNCGCPGLQTEAKNWDAGVEGYIQESGHTHYKDFLDSIKSKCQGRRVTPTEAWERYQAKHKREADERKPN